MPATTLSLPLPVTGGGLGAGVTAGVLSVEVVMVFSLFGFHEQQHQSNFHVRDYALLKNKMSNKMSNFKVIPTYDFFHEKLSPALFSRRRILGRTIPLPRADTWVLHTTWIIHATSPARMQGRRGEAVWTYCEPRITPQTGWNRRAEGHQGSKITFLTQISASCSATINKDVFIHVDELFRTRLIPKYVCQICWVEGNMSL